MNILGIDTSGGTCCIALLSDGTLRGEININYNKTHSQVLMPMLDTIRSMTELSLDSLDAIAVAAGPGSFTGLRIGSATAKGLGLSLDIPIIPVPTLMALAYRAWGFQGLICPIMDARRSQVYTGIYRFSGDEGIYSVHPDCALPIEELAILINRYGARDRDFYVMFLGDGVPVFRERLTELINIPCLFAPAHTLLQSGGAVAALGEQLFLQGVRESAAEHRPIYLRKPQAEREREAAGDKKAVNAIGHSFTREEREMEAANDRGCKS